MTNRSTGGSRGWAPALAPGARLPSKSGSLARCSGDAPGLVAGEELGRAASLARYLAQAGCGRLERVADVREANLSGAHLSEPEPHRGAHLRRSDLGRSDFDLRGRASTGRILGTSAERTATRRISGRRIHDIIDTTTHLRRKI